MILFLRFVLFPQNLRNDPRLAEAVRFLFRESSTPKIDIQEVPLSTVSRHYLYYPKDAGTFMKIEPSAEIQSRRNRLAGNTTSTESRGSWLIYRAFLKSPDN